MPDLYKGIFNYHGEKMEEWVRANSPDQAFRLMTARIGVASGKTAYSVRQYFDSKFDRFFIRKYTQNGGKDEQSSQHDNA